MIKEYSFGGIIFRRENNAILYLAIFSGRNQVWGFPKGHIETGESEDQAALREIEEETGLKDLQLIPGFREENVYPAVSRREPHTGETIEKHSIYFLYETHQNDIATDGHEITGHTWLPAAEALDLLPRESLKKILQNAHMYIERHVPGH